MTLHKIKSFSLKTKDFASGKLVSPPREFWETCDCCGKAIVMGAILSNGHKVGNDCHEVIWRFNPVKDNTSLFAMFGTAKRVQEYCATHKQSN